MLKHLIKIAFAVIILMPRISLAQGSPIKWDADDFKKLRSVLEEYTNDNTGVKTLDLLGLAIKKFDNKKGQKIDREDLNMLYGHDRKLGAMDYMMYLYPQKGYDPNLVVISISRRMGYSLADVIKSSFDDSAVIQKYIDKIKVKIQKEDIPVILDDGMLKLISDLAPNQKDYEKKTEFLFDTQKIIENIKPFNGQLNDEQMSVLAMSTETFYYAVDMYNANLLKTSADPNSLPEDFMSIILSASYKSLSDDQLSLLVGDNGTYYKMVAEAEKAPMGSQEKYNKMARVELLNEYILPTLEGKVTLGNEKDKVRLNQYLLFNKFYSADTYWEFLPDTYRGEIKFRSMVKYVSEFQSGKNRVPCSISSYWEDRSGPSERSLAEFLSNQREEFIDGTLSQRRIKALNEMPGGMIWDKIQAEWAAMYGLCEEFVTANKTMPSQTSENVLERKMGEWLDEQYNSSNDLPKTQNELLSKLATKVENKATNLETKKDDLRSALSRYVNKEGLSDQELLQKAILQILDEIIKNQGKAENTTLFALVQTSNFSSELVKTDKSLSEMAVTLSSFYDFINTTTNIVPVSELSGKFELIKKLAEEIELPKGTIKK